VAHELAQTPYFVSDDPALIDVGAARGAGALCSAGVQAAAGPDARDGEARPGRVHKEIWTMMGVANREAAVSLCTWVRGVSDMMLSDFPAEKATHQPAPTDNHVLWVMGHMASTDGWIAKELGIAGVNVPESYGKLFGGGSKPVNDPKQYPSFAEVRKVYTESRAALLKWFSTAPDSALRVDLKDRTGGFTTDPVDAMFKLAWHEGWHFGQVASVRKARGLPNKMGA
jgi:hypothetical protein